MANHPDNYGTSPLQHQTDDVLEYLQHFPELERNYFDAYAYDTIWSLAYLYQHNQTNVRKLVDTIDFLGATVNTAAGRTQSRDACRCRGE